MSYFVASSALGAADPQAYLNMPAAYTWGLLEMGADVGASTMCARALASCIQRRRRGVHAQRAAFHSHDIGWSPAPALS